MAESDSVYKRLRPLLAALIGLGGLYIVLSRVELSEIYQNVLKADPVLYVTSFLVLFLVYLLMGERWHWILKEKDVDIDRKESVSQLLISNFVNMFLPARAGDIYRGVISSDENKNSYETGVMVLMERILDVTVIGGLLILFALVSFQNLSIILYAFAAVLIGLLTLIGLKMVKKVEKFPLEALNSRYQSLRKILLENFKSDRKLSLIGITVLIWLFGALRFFTISEAMSMELGFWIIGLITFSWAVIAALPLTPAGLGTVDASVFFILSTIGVNNADAATFILLNRTVLQGLPLIFGGILYFKRQYRLSTS